MMVFSILGFLVGVINFAGAVNNFFTWRKYRKMIADFKAKIIADIILGTNFDKKRATYVEITSDNVQGTSIQASWASFKPGDTLIIHYK